MEMSIDKQINRLRDRKIELQRELDRIEQIEADLERTVEEALRTIGAASTGALSGARAAVRAERSKAKRKPTGNGGRGRPKGSGKRQAQAVKIISSAPGIRTSEVAKKMGIGPNYLYRLLPDLEKDGEISKRGTGWYPGKSQSSPASD